MQQDKVITYIFHEQWSCIKNDYTIHDHELGVMVLPWKIRDFSWTVPSMPSLEIRNISNTS